MSRWLYRFNEYDASFCRRETDRLVASCAKLGCKNQHGLPAASARVTTFIGVASEYALRKMLGLPWEDHVDMVGCPDITLPSGQIIEVRASTHPRGVLLFQENGNDDNKTCPFVLVTKEDGWTLAARGFGYRKEAQEMKHFRGRTGWIPIGIKQHLLHPMDELPGV